MRGFLLLVLFAVGADGATLVVDTSSDSTLSACTAAVNDCSLRGALITANATVAEDLIEFNIPTSDAGFVPISEHWLILVGATALPPIENPVVIDGFSQPGAIENSLTPDDGGLNSVLKIELRPVTSGGSLNGLDTLSNNFAMPASTFRGLAISRFQSQIQLAGGSGHRIEGCYLGTDISGTAASITTGSGNGVRVQGPGPYQIGGLLPAQRNLISGLSGAITAFSGSSGLHVLGNLIGTDVNGTLAIPNRSDAISSSAPMTNARIGGSTSAARNVISASYFSALRLFSQSAGDFSGTLIEGNYFGTDVSGRLPLGNGLNPQSTSQPQPTIQIGGLNCALTFGGTAPGQANLIAFGGAAGILNDQCPRIASPLNHYYANRGIPFDNVFGGGAVGATPNDVDDADNAGGNRLQNFPELTIPGGFLPGGGASVALQYRVDTAIANASYPITVNFYRGDCGGGSRALIASDTYGPADAQLLRDFVLEAADGGNVLPLVLTAVDAVGNTSEFGPMSGDAIFRSDFEDTPAALKPGSCL